jgi:hypothetical protein
MYIVFWKKTSLSVAGLSLFFFLFKVLLHMHSTLLERPTNHSRCWRISFYFIIITYLYRNNIKKFNPVSKTLTPYQIFWSHIKNFDPISKILAPWKMNDWVIVTSMIELKIFDPWYIWDKELYPHNIHGITNFVPRNRFQLKMTEIGSFGKVMGGSAPQTPHCHRNTLHGLMTVYLGSKVLYPKSIWDLFEIYSYNINQLKWTK